MNLFNCDCRKRIINRSLLTNIVYLFILIELFNRLTINHKVQAKISGSSEESTKDPNDENEFAEFEEFDEDDEFVRPITPTASPSQESQSSSSAGQVPDKQQQQPQQQSSSSPSSFAKNDPDLDSMIVEEDDDEEFETVREEIEDDKPLNFEENKKEGIEITKIPLHLRANWESYYIEFLIVLCLAVYFLNYAAGRSRNIKLATAWFEKHKDILEYNFTLVGDDGKQEIQNHALLKETENIYVIWCSGRVSIDGMLIEIRLIKRQDLFSTIINYFKPTNDKIIIKTFLAPDSMDNFIFCIAQRKIAPKLSKEFNDLATYCPERKSPEKYGVTSNNYLMLNEIGEAASFVLDAKVNSLLDKNDDIIEFLHISDQFSGVRNDDMQPTTKLPEVRKVLFLSLNLPSMSSHDLEEMDRLKPLLQMVFYLVDKLKRFRLSREKKLKSDRNRQKVERLFLQSTHQQRQEAAQMKREEKRRAEKEKMLQEMDPEKQRKWEEKEYKRELKRKIPKMKQLKVKAM